MVLDQNMQMSLIFSKKLFKPRQIQVKLVRKMYSQDDQFMKPASRAGFVFY